MIQFDSMHRLKKKEYFLVELNKKCFDSNFPAPKSTAAAVLEHSSIGYKFDCIIYTQHQHNIREKNIANIRHIRIKKNQQNKTCSHAKGISSFNLSYSALEDLKQTREKSIIHRSTHIHIRESLLLPFETSMRMHLSVWTCWTCSAANRRRRPPSSSATWRSVA